MPEAITKRAIPVPPALQLFTITETAIILGRSESLERLEIALSFLNEDKT